MASKIQYGTQDNNIVIISNYPIQELLTINQGVGLTNIIKCSAEMPQ
jgi:hypothetical protein